MKVLVAMLGLAVLAGSATLPAAAQSSAATPAAPAAGDSAAAAPAPAAAAPAAAAPAAPPVAPGSATSVATSGSPAKVEATIEQIESLISAPPEARIGREVDEGKNHEVLFGDPKRISQLLGDDPRFVYIPAGGDPMIVPWIRERVMALEMVDEAKSLYKQKQLQQSLQKCKTVIDQFPGTDAAKSARELQQVIEKELAGRDPGDTAPPDPALTQTIPLPPWIQSNTRGVAFNESAPADSIVLVGDFALRPGDTIPSYPGITIKEVAKGMVTYDYQGSLFKVPVEGR